ncbi:hypothetical protein JOB18_014630 [Solea senegalensis]|uniref:Uncharacterized protein n=1 Tax=Solea senegalensis TaxID=28829 RepID=A0AAV6Q6V1_SOLSE|nr:hypothetical protein JOB18_014630 [Solea senegalensis]
MIMCNSRARVQNTTHFSARLTRDNTDPLKRGEKRGEEQEQEQERGREINCAFIHRVFFVKLPFLPAAPPCC